MGRICNIGGAGLCGIDVMKRPLGEKQGVVENQKPTPCFVVVAKAD